MGPAEFDLASVDLVLRTTRSVRRKLDYSRPVASELIEECIEIALQARALGFSDLRTSGLRKVVQGTTSLAEVNRVTTGH